MARCLLRVRKITKGGTNDPDSGGRLHGDRGCAWRGLAWRRGGGAEPARAADTAGDQGVACRSRRRQAKAWQEQASGARRRQRGRGSRPGPAIIGFRIVARLCATAELLFAAALLLLRALSVLWAVWPVCTRCAVGFGSPVDARGPSSTAAFRAGRRVDRLQSAWRRRIKRTHDPMGRSPTSALKAGRVDRKRSLVTPAKAGMTIQSDQEALRRRLGTSTGAGARVAGALRGAWPRPPSTGSRRLRWPFGAAVLRPRDAGGGAAPTAAGRLAARRGAADGDFCSSARLRFSASIRLMTCAGRCSAGFTGTLPASFSSISSRSAVW